MVQSPSEEDRYKELPSSTMSRTDDSFSLNDLPTTTLSVEAPVFDWDRSEILYWIVAWAQGRSVDFLPVTPQGALQSLGIGLTATVQQSYVNPRMELAYKPSDPRNLARFWKELQILSIPRIRLHPFIATLEGLSWDVAEADNSISPIFVFQKARLGDLEIFMGSERGISMLPAERLALCCQIAIAMADLEDMSCIHGDLKPKNILVYEEEAHNGALVIRVTDFGHATDMNYTKGTKWDDGLIYLPESKPWSIPPPEYHSRGFKFQAAAKAMVYSLGACCLWLLLYNLPDNPGGNFPSGRRDVPNEPLLHLAQHQLLSKICQTHEARASLANVFHSSLTLDVETRAGSAATILGHLQKAFQAELSFFDTNTSLISTRYAIFDNSDMYNSFINSEMAFPAINICIAMQSLNEVDPKIREALFNCIREREVARRSVRDYHWHFHCIELAHCYYIGFGTRRNEALSADWLEKSRLHSRFAGELEALRSRPRLGYLPWTSWSKQSYSDVQTTSYNVSYYLGRRPLRKVIEVMRNELSDWKAALGPKHWVIRSRLSTIFSLEIVNEKRSALQTALEAHNLDSYQSQADPLGHSTYILSLAYDACDMVEEADQTAIKLLQILDQQSGLTDRRNTPQFLAMRAGAKSLLANACESKSKLGEAEDLRRESLRDLTRILGEEHPLALEQMAHLASLLSIRGKKKESRQLFERLERIATSSWSSSHDLALLAQRNLRQAPNVFWWFLRRSHPKLFHKEVIESYQFTVGNYNNGTITAMQSGVWLLCQEFRWVEALELMEHTLRHAAIAFRDNPAMLKNYQRKAKTVRWMCFNHGNKFAIWFFKLRFRWAIGLPMSVLVRLHGAEKLQSRYQHVWGPFYKVKALWVAREPYHFDPFKDPDYTERGNDDAIEVDAVEAQNYPWFRWFSVNQLHPVTER